VRRIAADLRYATRVVLKNPRFSMVAVAALALGFGANAAIFSVVNGVLLQPLPYPEPDRLVRVCRQFPAGSGLSASIPKYMAWSRAQSFDSVAAYDFAGPGLNLGGGERPEQVKGIHVSAGYFRVFGVSAERGRTFTADEDKPGGPRVAVLSHRLWVSRFGSDPKILDRVIALNGDPYTVVGVLPNGYRPDPPADIFIALQADPNSTNQGHFLSVAARLKPGATLASARAELKLIGDEFRRANPQWMGNDEQATAERMQDIAVRDVRPALLILLGAVGLVLLIACANVANLLLARAAGRQKEVAVRSAIGARRSDIISQLLAESLLLAVLGALIGVGLGVWGARVLIALSPGNLPRAEDLAHASVLASMLDWRLLAFTAGITLLTGVLFGLAPALHLARADVGLTLKEGGGRGSSGVRASRTRGALVIAETALALVLLVGATLLIRSFVGLRAVQPGFETKNVLTLQTSLAGGKYSTTAQLDRLVRDLTQRIDALPGVQASAMSIALPPEGSPDLPFRIEGRELKGDARFHGDEDWICVSSEYFRALSIPLMRGRVFDLRDGAGSTPVVIISAALAKKYWPDGDPIGQQMTIAKGLGPEFEDPTRQIVGVVGDVRQNGLDQPAPPVIYVPDAQVSDALTRLGTSIVPFSWIVRTASNPIGLTAAIQKEVLTVDPLLAISRVKTLDEVVATSIAAQNFNMLLLTIFGTIALLLAAIGIYGLMSYSVEQSAHDIGVRLALGADRRDIMSLVVGRGMRLAGAGLVVGLVAAYGLTRVLGRLLFGVRASDPATYAAVAVALGCVALLACYLPARRAMALDPIIVLRQE
jgi:putative ABC transport system permease protein